MTTVESNKIQLKIIFVNESSIRFKKYTRLKIITSSVNQARLCSEGFLEDDAYSFATSKHEMKHLFEYLLSEMLIPYMVFPAEKSN